MAQAATRAGYDAIVVVSFGGPEAPADVEPFLDMVLRGRPVPQERRAAVGAHYHHFGGRSPINDLNRELVAALKQELADHGPDLAVYWGNRNWHPFLADAVQEMKADGVMRALAFVTSAYASYSGCHQYLDDIARAREAAGPGAPAIDKMRVFYNHPGFVAANADAMRTALAQAGPGAGVAFTAHSIPVSMAATSAYRSQLAETAGLVMATADPGGTVPWSLVFQSRSGAPGVAWLEPDILDHLRALAGGPRAQAAFSGRPGCGAAVAGPGPVIVAPIGFVADHMEVVYDLDFEAAHLAATLGLKMVRAATAGSHPAFVTMIRQLAEERVNPGAPRLAVGADGPYHDRCLASCCPAPAPRPALAATPGSVPPAGPAPTTPAALSAGPITPACAEAPGNPPSSARR